MRYYLSSFQGIAFYEEGAEVKILAGRLPQNENEAMISDFTFESMQFGKLTDENGTNVELNGYEDFAKIPAIPLPFGGKTVEIVGVYEAEKVSAAYLPIKEASLAHRPTDYDTELEKLIDSWNREQGYGFYAYLLAHESLAPAYFDYVQALREEEEARPPAYIDDCFLESDTEAILMVEDASQNYSGSTRLDSFNTYDDANGLPLLDLYDLSGKALNAVGGGEIVLSVVDCGEILQSDLTSLILLRHKELVEAGETEKAQALWGEYYAGDDKISDAVDTLHRYSDGDDTRAVLDALALIGDFLQRYEISIPLTLSNEELFLDESVQIAGVFISNYGYRAYLGKDLFDKFYRSYGVNISYEDETNYLPSENAYLDTLFIPQSAYRSLRPANAGRQHLYHQRRRLDCQHRQCRRE